VARFDALSSAGQIPPRCCSELPAINWVTVTGHVNGGMRARRARRGARRRGAPRTCATCCRAAGAGQAPDRAARRVSRWSDSIELGGEGKNVSLGLSVPIEVIDHLASLRNAPGAEPPVAAP
jgi:hypothetical protein